MERNWKEKAFLDEYMRQKAKDQYIKDNTKQTSSRYKNIGTVITYGAIVVVLCSLIINFSDMLGFQATNFFDKTLMIPIIIILGVFYFLLKS